MPLHVLEELQSVETMRAQAETADSASGPAVERLVNLMAQSAEYVKKRVEKRTHSHRKRKQQLIGQIRNANRLLGTHRDSELDAVPDPVERERRRAEATAQRVDAVRAGWWSCREMNRRCGGERGGER